MLVVTNDNIRPPIIVQNRRNKHTFDTYAFTIDLVPLVFEKTCFVGHTIETKWKTNKNKQKAQSRRHNAEMRKGDVYTKIWKKCHRDSKAPKIMSSRNQLRADRN